MDLIQQIRENEHSEHTAAWATIRELLPADDLKTADLKRLKGSLGVVNVAAEQLPELRRVLEKAAALATQAGLADAPELTERIVTAAAVLASYREATVQLMREREGEEARLFGEVTGLTSRRSGGAKAVRELGTLKARNHELFGEPEPAPEAKCEPSCTTGTWPVARYLHPLRA